MGHEKESSVTLLEIVDSGILVLLYDEKGEVLILVISVIAFSSRKIVTSNYFFIYG